MEARRVPGHLLHIYSVLKCAYNEGIPNKDYYGLVGLLCERYSTDDAAYLLNLITSRTFAEVYENVKNFTPGEYASEFDVEKVKVKLEPCGFVE
jgi:hypothetical protein